MNGAGKKGWAVFGLHDCAPAWHDSNGMPVAHLNRQSAIDEILDDIEEHIRQIRAGERDYEDGIGFEDYVEEVTVLTDGRLVDSSGNIWGKRE